MIKENQMDDLMQPLPKQCSVALVQNWQGQSEYRELSEEWDEYSAKFSENQMREYAKKAVEAEREACAKEGWMAASSDCEDRVAAAIRARSNT